MRFKKKKKGKADYSAQTMIPQLNSVGRGCLCFQKSGSTRASGGGKKSIALMSGKIAGQATDSWQNSHKGLLVALATASALKIRLA